MLFDAKVYLFSKQFTEGNRQLIPVPVRYEMKGFNSLLGSHYDHYYLDYTTFTPEKPNANAFIIDSGEKF